MPMWMEAWPNESDVWTEIEGRRGRPRQYRRRWIERERRLCDDREEASTWGKKGKWLMVILSTFRWF